MLIKGFLKISNAVLGKPNGSLSSQTQDMLLKASQIGMTLCEHFSGSSSSQGNGGAEADEKKSEVEKKRDVIGFPSSSSPNSPSTSSSRPRRDEKEKAGLEKRRASMRENSVPATQFGRVLGFGTLAAQLALGMTGERVARMTGLGGGRDDGGISEASAERLAEALCRMRGAALKLGQMMSIQDTDGYLPPALEKALARVRESADYMPEKQLRRQLEEQLGADWDAGVTDFDLIPIAAASIGQVHRAKLDDDVGTTVAIKVQYPGVATSIESDLRNLKVLVTTFNVLPKGLYIDEIMSVAGGELKEECDYVREAVSQRRYKELVEADPVLSKHTYVPKVIDALSTDAVLTSEFVHGIPLDRVVDLDQTTRNAIARTVLFLTIKELFEWRFMQTDPNFANFLYDQDEQRINLIDFGASREYDKSFVDGYMRVVWAAANRDSRAILDASRELGFLTGHESPEMIQAHVEAGMVVGEPFNTAPGEAFDFSGSKLTQRIGKHGATFVQHRLTPPPPEAYSLHRKLAGAFLLCIKLNATIECRDILEMTYSKYSFN